MEPSAFLVTSGNAFSRNAAKFTVAAQWETFASRSFDRLD
jgi:hypothetical protein